MKLVSNGANILVAGSAIFNIAGHPQYQGYIKVQASGQLLIGKFTNAVTQAPSVR